MAPPHQVIGRHVTGRHVIGPDVSSDRRAARAHMGVTSPGGARSPLGGRLNSQRGSLLDAHFATGNASPVLGWRRSFQSRLIVA